MSMTTIKVSSELRDQLNTLAEELGRTANGVVELLLEEYVWNQRMATVREQMANAAPDEVESYRDEVAAWDSTLSDGLPGW